MVPAWTDAKMTKTAIGDYCDLAEGVCTSTPCYDSHLDCGFKEYCDQQSGDCREASGYFAVNAK